MKKQKTKTRALFKEQALNSGLSKRSNVKEATALKMAAAQSTFYDTKDPQGTKNYACKKTILLSILTKLERRFKPTSTLL